jgi:UDP-N-acetylglucosamine 2-epimerase (non-hydrolysing)/GDP/UDP-N,N'-diacetylbacillosamine 2-epimerase (hydrolysing)
MAKRKILVTLESRATYGYSKNVMLEMQNFPELETVTLVTGMHLIPELGHTIDLIRDDGFPISATVPLAPEDSRPGAWSRAMGSAINGFASAYEKLEPDIILLSGDRVETFSCCVAASYMGIPMAHIQAGDKSGHIDDLARMAMAKLCHIHFASCADSADRVWQLGEEKFRIFNVGAPQLDDIVDQNRKAGSVKIAGTSYDLSKPYILLVQHPVMVERQDTKMQMENAFNAVTATGLPVFWIYPNSDLGFQDILDTIEGRNGSDLLTILKNVERDDYLTLLANAGVLVGNSSSGILEAPSFKVPVINIGNRQRGRPQAANILNSEYPALAISSALDKALNDAAFREACTTAVNPYGDGSSSKQICEILRDIPIDTRLIDKQTIY